MEGDNRTNMNEHIGDESKIFACNICGKSYSQSILLNLHEIIHNDSLSNGMTKGNFEISSTESPRNITENEELYEHKKATDVDIPNVLQTKSMYQPNGTAFENPDLTSNELQFAEVELHSQSGADEKSFKCENCQGKFKNMHDFNWHMQTDFCKPKVMYPCDSCGESFYRKSRLENHRRIHIVKDPYKCKRCQEGFAGFYLLSKHQEHCAPYQCTKCPKSFIDNQTLTRHMAVHSDATRYECETCKTKFKLKTYLNSHMKEQHGDQLFSCSVCDATFNRKNNLQYHEKGHVDMWQFQCEKCPQMFKYKRLLEAHVLTNHTVKERLFACDVCAMSFTQLKYLKKHQGTHNKNSSFRCHICNKDFSTKFGLSKHLKLHLRDNEFGCNVCAKKFSSFAYLLEHKRTHKGEKRFKCQFCDAAFVKNANLRQHLVVHMRGKEFKCDVCYRSFDQRCSWYRHMANKHPKV